MARILLLFLQEYMQDNLLVKRKAQLLLNRQSIENIIKFVSYWCLPQII